MNKDSTLVGNEEIEQNIKVLKDCFTDENLAVVLTTIRNRIKEGGQFVVAVDATSGTDSLSLKTANYNGQKWFIAYTCFDEELKGKLSVMSGFLADIDKLFELTINSNEVSGILINPYGNMMTLNKQIIEVILGNNI